MADETHRKYFDLHEKEIRAYPLDKLVRINVEIGSAVIDVEAMVPALLQFREQILEELPKWPIKSLDNLEGYCKALGHIQALYLTSVGPTKTVAQLAQSAEELRAIFETDGAALARRKLIDSAAYTRAVTKVAGKRSYKSLVYQLLGLVEVLRKDWGKIQQNTGVTEQELDEAERLASALSQAIGLRERGEEDESDASEIATLRRQGYSVFWNSFDDVRQALAFLRWKFGDADKFAPGLQTGRTAGSGSGGGEEGGGGDAGGSDGGGGAGGEAKPTAGAKPVEPVAADKPTAPKPIIKPGFPGGDPFEPGTDESLK